MKRIKSLLKCCDQHGAPISLTYLGKTSYQTCLGGTITILSRLGILAYFFVIVSLVIHKDKTVANRYVAKSATSDIQQYHITLDDFDIAYGLYFKNISLPDVKTNLANYFDVKIQSIQNLYLRDENGVVYRKQFVNNIPTTSCSLNRFANLTDEMKNYGLEQSGWLCPQNIDVNVTGQPQSLNQTRIRFLVNLCQNTTSNNNSCAPLDTIRFVTNYLFFQVATLNTYFDEDNFESKPIKRSINVETYPVVLNQTYFSLRTLRKNYFTLKDNWLSSSFGNEEEVFYSDQLGLQKVGADYTQLLILTYSCDSQENFITRKVLSIADAASIAGGFASIIILLTKLLAKIYALPFFYQSIFTKIFEYQPIQNKMEWKSFKSQSVEQQLFTINSQFRQRKTLVLNSFKGMCFNFVQKIFRLFKQNDISSQYTKAITLYQKHIDIVKLLKTVNKLKMFERIILKDYQRAILKLKSKYIITQEGGPGLRKSRTKTNIKITDITDDSMRKILKHRKQLVNRNILRNLLEIKEEQEDNDKTQKPKHRHSVTPRITADKVDKTIEFLQIDGSDSLESSKRELMSTSFMKNNQSLFNQLAKDPRLSTSKRYPKK